MSSVAFPTQARVVIAGGGIIGCSIAYHLIKIGCRDVLLLERARLTCGTTWHAAGLLTTLRDTETQTRLAAYSQDLYRRIEKETGQPTGIIECGSIQLALTAAKTEEMRRGIRAAQSFGIECEEISVTEAQRLWPLAKFSDVLAAFHFPRDGRVNPTDITQALAKGARNGGARIIENCAVTGFRREKGRVTGVETTQGTVDAEIVVNCAGMWARELGNLAGVDIPLIPAEHYYLISEPIAGVHPSLPILRDPGRSAYIREEAGKVMVGIFEPVGRPWSETGVPNDFTFGEIDPDWERMHPYLERAMERVPILSDSGIKLLFCGPESFTPDHNYLMGEAPNLKGYFVAAGFNSLGILSAGGVGSVMADWIVRGHPQLDVWSVNIRRTHSWQNNTRFLADRVVESLGIGYQDHWPFRQWESARNVKKSPLHDRLRVAGASFGESAGWERPNWYARAGQLADYEYSWGRQNWFENCAEEHRAIRSGVGLIEQSSFAKFLVQGRDAETALNYIATADCRAAIGKVLYSQFLNERGGIEADLSIIRLESDSFLIVTAAFTATHVGSWLKSHIDAKHHCFVVDVSDSWCVLNIQGPNSRGLLQHLSPETDWSNSAFPFATAKCVPIGYQNALAVRLTYAGELGWELFVPVPFALGVYDAVVEAGKHFALHHCGYHALNSLRIEKAYREWSHDIGPDDSPLEAGLAFTCAWDKPGGFIGREALLESREVPRTRRLVQFLLRDPIPFLYHNEPILMNGLRVGLITSGMYGHTLGGAVGLGYVENRDGVSDRMIETESFEILIGNEKYEAIASLRPLYDPRSERARC